MTLTKKKKAKKSIGRKTPGLWFMEDGLHDMSKPGHPLIAPYPIFLGTEYVQGISETYPVKMEFVKEGKFYYVVFYDPKLGMVGKARIPTVHAVHIIEERISKKKAVGRKEIEKILLHSRTKIYR